jgi:glycine/D-amino acid oxidase-like deaminating enzyme
MGHVVVMDDSEAQFALTSFSRRLWHRLAPELPADAEYHRCGTLWVAADEPEMDGARRKAAFYADHGVAVELLDPPALAEAESHCRRDLAGGLRVVDDAVIYPPAAARYLLEQARGRGAEVRDHTEVRAICDDGQVVLADSSRISAGRVINAAGCDSPSLTAGLPIRKRKGHLVITDRYPGYVRHQIVELGYLKSAHSTSSDSVAFNVQPRKTGQILIGSSRQFGAETSDVEPGILGRMLRRAIEYLPSLPRLTAIRAWTGFRAATPDKLPLIGPSPSSDRIWLATGHEGLGITTSLATARLVVDLILGKTPSIPAAPYLPGRMAGGALHG